MEVIRSGTRGKHERLDENDVRLIGAEALDSEVSWVALNVIHYQHNAASLKNL